MALPVKTPIDINFSGSLNTKSDPYQIPVGQFLSLVNSIFDTEGELRKRNGFGELPSLPTNNTVTATTLSDNLVAVGNSLQIFSQDTLTWYNKGPLQFIDLSVVPQVRSNTGQITCDAAVSSNGLSCVAWYDSDTNLYYKVTDSQTGQVIVNTTQLGTQTSSTVGAKVFILNFYFIVVYWDTIAATPTLRYVAVPIYNPTAPLAASSIGAGASITSPFDGYTSSSGNLYLSYPTSSTVLSVLYVNHNLVLSPKVTITTGSQTRVISVTEDVSLGVIYVAHLEGTGSSNLNARVYNYNLSVLTANIILGISISSMLEMTVTSLNGIFYFVYEVFGTIATPSGYTPTPPSTPLNQSDLVFRGTYNANTSTLTAATILLRGVGLASKAFYIDSTQTTYVLLTYGGLMQPTYFVSDLNGNIVAKLAQSNGGGYLANKVGGTFNGTTNLPLVNVSGNTVKIAYLYKDLTTSVNKTTNANGSQPAQIAGIYSQTGINLASFTFTDGGVISAELAGSLQTTGGFMWQYDGVKPVEHSFHLYPEDMGSSTQTTGGSMSAQTYFYVACYEWTDGQGLIHRSAPSVPIQQIVPAGTSTNRVQLTIPYLRLTYKVAPNPVRIVVYRWSTANQIYYQITSITNTTGNNPIIPNVSNDPLYDAVQYLDVLGDSSIIGNTILYTNGGVVEDIAAPALTSICPFNTRLFGIDSEDRNLLWFSKQVIENTPVEMSDLFTLYVAPTISASGTTGPMTCLSAMDDKLLIFKKDAIYYITGTGPDNTGANNDFSNPTFITSTVGSSNQKSLVLIPSGVMFQSDKGIWLLGRDLSTTYIGAAVEAFNSELVVAANTIPGTNQVRFRLESGTTLMYDYFYNKWGTFIGIKGATATIYQGLETVITAPLTVSPPNTNPYVLPPQVFQETPGLYLDGSLPVLISFQTGWLSMAGLQGYERLYQMLFLGNYISPFKLNVSLAYNNIPSSLQLAVVTPLSAGPLFGLAPGPYGSQSPFGGNPTPFKARVFPDKQKCESFQITVQESYDPNKGPVAGAGLTLSGIQCLVGVKKGSRTSAASRSFN